jgi:hypothetical protein
MARSASFPSTPGVCQRCQPGAPIIYSTARGGSFSCPRSENSQFNSEVPAGGDRRGRRRGSLAIFPPCTVAASPRRQKDATTRLSRPSYVPPYGPGFKGELSLLCGAVSVPYRISALQRQTQRLKSDDQKHEHIVLPARKRRRRTSGPPRNSAGKRDADLNRQGCLPKRHREEHPLVAPRTRGRVWAQQHGSRQLPQMVQRRALVSDSGGTQEMIPFSHDLDQSGTVGLEPFDLLAAGAESGPRAAGECDLARLRHRAS